MTRQIDATANQAEGLEANGFPTFLFYPANDKTPITFKGERTVRQALPSYLSIRTGHF
jgi:hypothetical protein